MYAQRFHSYDYHSAKSWKTLLYFQILPEELLIMQIIFLHIIILNLRFAYTIISQSSLIQSLIIHIKIVWEIMSVIKESLDFISTTKNMKINMLKVIIFCLDIFIETLINANLEYNNNEIKLHTVWAWSVLHIILIINSTIIISEHLLKL